MIFSHYEIGFNNENGKENSGQGSSLNDKENLSY